MNRLDTANDHSHSYWLQQLATATGHSYNRAAYVEVAEHGGDDVASLVAHRSAGATLAERVVDAQFVVVRRDWRRTAAQTWHVLAESRVYNGCLQIVGAGV